VAALRQRRRADPHRSGLVPRPKEKVYVQDKLREQGAELWRWINDGAHIYVCGDANRMAKDVEQALLEVIAEFGAMDAEAADEFLSELRVERRYQRDVY
jgi:sulfite reductase (NADPH) flavoprotein alpha-component